MTKPIPPNGRAGGRSRVRVIGRADRFQVVLHVDADALREGAEKGQAVLADGVRVSAETSRRLACDASRVVVVHDAEGNVLDVGRRTRTVPPALRRALEHRDRGCRFPGCGSRFVDAHHIRHWADGGETELTNLVLACRVHHRALHEEGFSVTLDENGEVRFFRPDGRPLPDVPKPPRLGGDSVEKLRQEHEELGLELDPWTTTPDWRGEPLDLGFALATLRGP